MASIQLQRGHRTGVSRFRFPRLYRVRERERAAARKHRAKGKSSKLHKVLTSLVFVLVKLFEGLNAFPSSYVLRNWGLSIDYRAHAQAPLEAVPGVAAALLPVPAP